MTTGRWHLLAHHHSGRRRSHHHTSYAGLAFILLLTGLLLSAVSWQPASAAVPAVNPQGGSVGLSGAVRGPAPDKPVVITTPNSGSSTTSSTLTIGGICTPGTFVQIMKNDVFAGAVPCSADGTFSLDIDLFDGRNHIVARVSDALGQFGPDSRALDVIYQSPSLNLPGAAAGRQLFLQAIDVVVGVSPDTALSRSVTIVGGTGPYAISFDWGDGSTSLVSQVGEGPVSASHIYTRAGNYRVLIRVTDATGNSSFLQLVTVVNGPAAALGANKNTGSGALPGLLLTAWPLYVLAVVMVVFFWLGTRLELRRLRRQGRLNDGYLEAV